MKLAKEKSQYKCALHDINQCNYFTSKDKFGASTLISLADFKNVRKTELFSKRYLAGFYAALPDMTKGL